MAMRLYCRACESPNDFDRNWVTDDDECSTCGTKKQWRTCAEPKKAYDLNHNDKLFLHSIRVKPDE